MKPLLFLGLIFCQLQTFAANPDIERLRQESDNAKKSIDSYKLQLEQQFKVRSKLYDELQQLRQNYLIADQKQKRKEISMEERNAAVYLVNAKVEEIGIVDNQMKQTRSEIDYYKDIASSFNKNFDLVQNNVILSQLATHELTSENNYELIDTIYKVKSSKQAKVSPGYCELYHEKRAELRKQERPNWMEASLYLSYCQVDVRYDLEDDRVEGFDLVNESSNRVNPKGDLMSSRSPFRKYRFNFRDRSRQAMDLMIEDDTKLTGKISRDQMLKKIVFIPRTHIPSLSIDENNPCHRNVTLPTGELVVFHALTNEIIQGALKEDPIDFNPNRSVRKDPQVFYTGKGLTISVSRRGSSPTLVHKERWNKHDTVTHANVEYAGKQCWVKKELLWKDADDEEKLSDFIYDSDEELLDKVINPVCGWNVKVEDLL